MPVEDQLIEDSPDFQDTDPGKMGFGFVTERDPAHRILSLNDDKITPAGKEILKQYQVPSVLMIPVMVNSKTGGLIGIASDASSRAWHEEEISLLDMIAKCLGRGMEKKIPIERLQKSEKKYRELSSLLRLLADNMTDMLWAKDMDRRYIFANRSICRNLLNAESTDEPVGRTDLTFALREREAHPDDPEWHTFGELCMDSDRIVMDTGKPHRFDEFGNVRGRYLHLDVRKAPIINDEGEMIGTVGSAREVTREKQLENQQKEILEALMNRERVLRDSQRLAGMGSWTFDLASGRRTCSEEMRTLFGLDDRPMADEDYEALLCEVDGQEFRDMITRALECGDRELDYEHRIRKPDGHVVWVHSRIRIEYDDDGDPLKLFGVIQDITWRRKLEEDKLKLERRILHAQKLESLGILAGGIAHDFNNILMGILGNADLALREISPSSPAYDKIRSVIDNSNVASELSNQMLAYSGRGSFKVEPIDLSRTIRGMENLLKTSISKSVTLKTVLSSEDTGMLGDLTQLRQIVMNLVLNASESYGEDNGEITVTTGRVVCDHDCISSIHPSSWQRHDSPPVPGEYVFLEVTDQGCGMDEKTRERIFEPFFSTKFSGRGLGLAAVMGIVKSHGGLVTIDTSPGKGSSFRILFPAGAEAPEGSARPEGRNSIEVEGTILLVDDEPSVRNVVTRMLDKAGFSVLSAGSGQEALEMFRKDPGAVSCVLLDMTMPRMSGTRCLENLRKMDPKVKVIISSGFTREDVARKFDGEEITGFIQKPYRYEDLMNVLSATLGTSEDS
jgi:PAS domain S-box-containing protein